MTRYVEFTEVTLFREKKHVTLATTESVYGSNIISTQTIWNRKQSYRYNAHYV